MTPIREAFVLPGIFLTVALLGGLRIAGEVRLLPPPLLALVLALLLVASLARSGALRPEMFMHAGRTRLENLSGLVVLLTLFAASTQVFHVVIPDRGLLHLLFGTFFFIQLLSTMAGGTGRVGFLRSLVVLFGSAFVLRWIVLEALYAPDSGLLKRLFTALAGGVTLGAVEYVPHGAVTGYTAFFTVALYLAGLALLTPTSGSGAMVLSRPSADSTLPVAGLLVCLLVSGACGSSNPASAAERPPAEAALASSRSDALRRAQVWRPPAVPIPEANLAENPAGGFAADEAVACTFTREPVGGTTPKFYCRMSGGDDLKVKYGDNNAELPGEVAATRLLSALGFGADRMYRVRSVACAGCPPFPFQALRCHERTGLETCFAGAREDRPVEFRSAVIERRAEGRKIEAFEDQGWSWFELSEIDESAGGASVAEVDALRLLAVLLAHWDNKGANQRLLCPPEAEMPGGGCARPMAMMQDVGATFGPTKVDLPNWRRAPVWANARTCTVSMASLPWSGATFPDRDISEQGRQFLLGLLDQLTERQLVDLFSTSGVSAHDQVSVWARDPRQWVATFQDKVRQIRDAGPCPH